MLGLYLIYYVVCEGKDNTGVQCLKIRILLALQSNLLSNFTFLARTTLTCFYSVCTLCLCNTLWRALDELPSCVNPNLSYSKAWRPCFIFIIQRNYKYIVISCRASFSEGDVPTQVVKDTQATVMFLFQVTECEHLSLIIFGYVSGSIVVYGMFFFFWGWGGEPPLNTSWFHDVDFVQAQIFNCKIMCKVLLLCSLCRIYMICNCREDEAAWLLIMLCFCFVVLSCDIMYLSYVVLILSSIIKFCLCLLCSSPV